MQSFDASRPNAAPEQPSELSTNSAHPNALADSVIEANTPGIEASASASASSASPHAPETERFETERFEADDAEAARRVAHEEAQRDEAARRARLEPVHRAVAQARGEIAKAVVGQDAVIGQLLVALLAGGHVLLEGVPGVAKTLSARALAAAIQARFTRIQFTPDLMPSDVTGTSVFNMRTQEFSLTRGPIFTDILLADEINRTPPKTQAALLEAMQEKRVTIDGQGHELSPLFTVIATQNPIDYEGTYPLPEAQTDRFLMKVLVDYPAPEHELALYERVHSGFDAHDLAASGLRGVVTPEAMLEARRAVRSVTVSDGLLRYIYEIVARTRSNPALSLGASPRAGLALLECAKALAALNGRDFLVPEDVKAVAPPVLRHRLQVRAESEMEGLKSDDVIRSLLAAVEVPR